MFVLILVLLSMGMIDAGIGDQKAWHELAGSYSSISPGKRFGQAALVTSTDGMYWELGGQDDDGELLGDLWTYDFTYHLWQTRHVFEPNGRSPAPRAFASLVQLGSRIFLYGGMCEAHLEMAGGDPCRDDLWYFDLLNPQRPWTHEASFVGGVKPPLRSGHIAASHGPSMYVYGGSAGAKFGRMGDNSPGIRETVWEYKYADKRWHKHDPANSSTPPLPSYGMAGSILFNKGELVMVVHGGIHMCGGKCVTKGGNRTSVTSYITNNLHAFSLGSGEWQEWPRDRSPSRAFHSLSTYKEADGVQRLYIQGGWGHNVMNLNVPEIQMEATPHVNGDLWSLMLTGAGSPAEGSVWRQVIPATALQPPARFAAGGGMLGGASPAIVVAGGLGCGPNATTSDIDDCESTLGDLYLFDLWGFMVGGGTVQVEANTAQGAPFIPSMLMILASGSIAGERVGVHSATFREVPKGPVTGVMMKHGLVLAAEHALLEPGATVSMQLSASEAVMHSFVLTKEDGVSRIAAAKVTVEVWDPMYNGDFGGFWRLYELLLSTEENNRGMYTDNRGEISFPLLPTEWDHVPHHLRSRYRLTCALNGGSRMIYKEEDLTVSKAAEAGPVSLTLVSEAVRNDLFEFRMEPVVLKPGHRSKAQGVGGQLGLFDYVYLDVIFDYVRSGQKAVVQIMSHNEETNMFALFGSTDESVKFPGPTQHLVSACQDGAGTGMQPEQYNTTRLHPFCALEWTFPKSTSSFHVRIGIVRWETLERGVGKDDAAAPEALYRVEIFYEDVTVVPPPPPPANQLFVVEEADLYQSGVNFVVLAVTLSLLVLFCAGCCYLCRCLRKQRKINKFKALPFSDMIFNRPNHEIDLLVAHEMENALRTKPKIAGHAEAYQIPVPEMRGGIPPGGPPMSLPPVSLRSKFAPGAPGSGSFSENSPEGAGEEGGGDSGVRGFMDGLEAMAAEYRRGLFGGPEQMATMSKAEATSTLRSRYEALHAEQRRDAANPNPFASMTNPVMKPLKAPPGIAPPPPRGGAPSTGASRAPSASSAGPPLSPANKIPILRAPPGVKPPSPSSRPSSARVVYSPPPSAAPQGANGGPGGEGRTLMTPPGPAPAPKGILPPLPRSTYMGSGSPAPQSTPPTPPEPERQTYQPSNYMAPQSSAFRPPPPPSQQLQQHSEMPKAPQMMPQGPQAMSGGPEASGPPPPLPEPTKAPMPWGRRAGPSGGGPKPTGLLTAPRGPVPPPPPPGASAAIWVAGDGGGAIRPPPPGVAPPMRPPPPPPPGAPPGGAARHPHAKKRSGVPPPLVSHDQMSEDQLIAMRMRALGSSGGGNEPQNVSRRKDKKKDKRK